MDQALPPDSPCCGEPERDDPEAHCHRRLHTPVRLRNLDGRLCLTGDLAIHLIELPKFRKGLEEPQEPPDEWLFFLQNGEKLDADALPGSLDIPEIRWAVGVPKMVGQNDLERELYEGWLKAKVDLQSLETVRDQWQERYMEAEHRLDVVSRERDAARRNAENEDSPTAYACPNGWSHVRWTRSRIYRSAALMSCATLPTAWSGT